MGVQTGRGAKQWPTIARLLLPGASFKASRPSRVRVCTRGDELGLTVHAEGPS
jgi:hypothetical protein